MLIFQLDCMTVRYSDGDRSIRNILTGNDVNECFTKALHQHTCSDGYSDLKWGWNREWVLLSMASVERTTKWIAKAKRFSNGINLYYVFIRLFSTVQDRNEGPIHPIPLRLMRKRAQVIVRPVATAMISIYREAKAQYELDILEVISNPPPGIL